MTQKGLYSFEILTTTACNLNCTYCFEGHKPADKGIVTPNKDKYIASIRYILNEQWFKDDYAGMNITFWGGEPTINVEIINIIMEEFKDEISTFFIYSNGVNTKKYKEWIEQISPEAIAKLEIQISYDGRVVNDKYRLTYSGKTSSSAVLETFDYLTSIPLKLLTFKQTLPIEDCNNMYDAWKEFKDFYYYYKNKKLNVQQLTIGYSPTIDSFKAIDDTYLEDFKTSINKIAKDEIDFFRKNGHFLMTWFGNEDARLNCATGHSMTIADEDGSFYACHGVLYLDDKKDHKLAEFGNLKGIGESRDKFEKLINRTNPECEGCVATTCYVCPTTVFQASEKTEFEDKWSDRQANRLCDFYKYFGKVDRSVYHFLTKKEK